jgi:hypothetical protein
MARRTKKMARARKLLKEKGDMGRAPEDGVDLVQLPKAFLEI